METRQQSKRENIVSFYNKLLLVSVLLLFIVEQSLEELWPKDLSLYNICILMENAISKLKIFSLKIYFSPIPHKKL